MSKFGKGTVKLVFIQALFPLLMRGARVVNVSSSAGRLSMIDGAEPAASALRDQFSSPQLTVPQLEKLMHNFIDLGKSILFD
jgi:carbonyl reductase 1